MKQDNSQSEINSAKSEFNDFLQRGDDFFKIELLRQAISWYKKALKIDNYNEMVKSRIVECERKLEYENRIVYILISIGSILVLAYLIFSK